MNGRPASSKRLGMLSNFVPRDDALSYSLTVRETLHYAADLRLPQSWSTERKRRRIEELLIDLRLEHCADAIVGSPAGGGGGGGGSGGGGADGGSGRIGGITPGERKKTSIAMDLLNNPSVLLVDEPTAGLNAKVRGAGTERGGWGGGASVARNMHCVCVCVYVCVCTCVCVCVCVCV